MTWKTVCNTIYYTMRAIVNISLPSQLNAIVEKEISSGKYASKSEFFRSLLRLWMENKLVMELGESREDLKNGKGKILKSLADLR